MGQARCTESFPSAKKHLNSGSKVAGAGCARRGRQREVTRNWWKEWRLSLLDTTTRRRGLMVMTVNWESTGKRGLGILSL